VFQQSALIFGANEEFPTPLTRSEPELKQEQAVTPQRETAHQACDLPARSSGLP